MDGAELEPAAGAMERSARAELAPGDVRRRRFLGRLTVAMLAAIGATLSVPLVAYLLSPLRDPRRVGWRDLGPLDQFPIGETVQLAFGDPTSLPWAGQTALTSAWVRRDGEASVTVFAVNCTHLGCPVSWRPETQLFLCPCHGGLFAADGSVAGGPPTRPLVRYETRLQGGNLQVLARGFRVR